MTKIYGLIAEFDQPKPLIEAARRAKDAGYRRMEAYTPFPIEDLTEALGRKESRLPFIVFLGGVAGAITGFGMQEISMTRLYPYLIGGKPLSSWPAWIPITFELTVLFAAFTAVIGMIALNGLPQPYHPVFNAAGFERASLDKFFLVIEARDPKFDMVETRRFLETLNPGNISDVSHSPDESASEDDFSEATTIGVGKWEI